MKPPDSFIKYLQAHPAVWEALQEEWEPKTGDWVTLTHKGERELNCLGTMDDSMDWAAWVKESLDYRIILWLPDLGQLVRMLQQEWSDWHNRLEIWILKETEGNKGAKAVIHAEEHHYNLVESSEWEEEPEIACAALWAKVKGVE